MEVNMYVFRSSPDKSVPLTVTYKNPDGSFDPDKIYIDGMEGEVEGSAKVFRLPVVAGMTTEYSVRIYGSDKQTKIFVTDSSVCFK